MSSLRGHLRRLPLASRRIHTAVRPLRADRAHTAVLLDIDGTLAPIVTDPASVAIPAPTRRVMRRLQAEYRLVGIVTGRAAVPARDLVGMDIDYIGSHGLESLAPGAAAAVPDPAATPWQAAVQAFFLAHCRDASLGAAGVLVNDKGLTIHLGWRGAADQARATAAGEAVAAAARAAGLRVLPSKAGFDIVPPLDITKGTGIEHLLDGHPEIRRVVYAGDDCTDVHAMKALHAMRRSGRLDSVVNVGVRSRETPAEVLAGADLVVRGTRGVRRVLRALA